jgi:serine/threonine protein kinase
MTVERYERQKLLGKGLMSHVWLARDTYTQKLVALKIMAMIGEDDRRNHKAQERFHREIEIACSLQHLHILTILN